MTSPSRRHILTAAAAALATVPALAAAQSTGKGSGAALEFASRAAASAATIPASVAAVFCGGYAQPGDRGEAAYARSAAEPAHAGKFRSADGAWWELAPDTINPFQFGAAGDGKTDDSGAIQAMFDFVVAKGAPYPIQFLGGRYYVAKGLILPTLATFGVIDVDGGGGTLVTDKLITILSRIPKDQDEAMTFINQSHYDIHHLEFRGSGVAGQTGLHIGAAYTNIVRDCLFARLEYGSIGSFCLAGAWRDNLYHVCNGRAFVIQTGLGYDQGPVWPGAALSTSASNVNVIENCRVFGQKAQKSAFGIFGSDSARVNGCISEGHTAGFDVHFDYQGSSTVKQFHVDMFHCESDLSLVNFKVRATGNVNIDRVIRTFPAPIYDANGSSNCQISITGISWLADMPTATGTGPNPNGRWFYQSDGGGVGAKAEGNGKSIGVSFDFDQCMAGSWKEISNPARWEGGVLPTVLHIREMQAADRGVLQWSTLPMTYASPIVFAEGNNFNGIMIGTVAPTTKVVPAQTTLNENFAVAGLLAAKHYVTLNPAQGVYAPPAGITWNCYVESDGLLQLRLANVTGRDISLPQGIWGYCATRSG